jgi:hypothetical protein
MLSVVLLNAILLNVAAPEINLFPEVVSEKHRLFWPRKFEISQRMIRFVGDETEKQFIFHLSLFRLL